MHAGGWTAFQDGSVSGQKGLETDDKHWFPAWKEYVEYQLVLGPENKGDVPLVAPVGNTKIPVLPAVEPCGSTRLLPAGFGLCKQPAKLQGCFVRSFPIPPACWISCRTTSHRWLLFFVPESHGQQGTHPQPGAWSGVELQDMSNSRAELWV